MKKSFFAILIVICLLTLPQGAFAQDSTSKFGIGAEISFNKIFDYNVDNEIDQERSFDGTAMPGVNLTYFFNQYFSTELTVAYAKTDMELESKGVSMKEGELEQTPLMLTFRAHMPTETILSPYIGAGLTYYFNEFDMSDTLIRKSPARTSITPDDGLGYHVNLGMEIFATDNLAFDLDAKYTWYEEEFEVSSPGRVGYDEKIELDSFSVGVGMKYYF
ncbi:MAG: outer membrane beta-barrel protein [Desulfatibacillum sp.]|nr:outer membrane beta-barrel protein [Desulfatibacillum sp.]